MLQFNTLLMFKWMVVDNNLQVYHKLLQMAFNLIYLFAQVTVLLFQLL